MLHNAATCFRRLKRINPMTFHTLQCVELLAKVFSKLLQWSSNIISSALVPPGHIWGLCVHGLQTDVQISLTFNPVIWLRQYVLCKPHSIGLAKLEKDMNDMNEHIELICNSPKWTWFAAFTNQPLFWGNWWFFNVFQTIEWWLCTSFWSSSFVPPLKKLVVHDGAWEPWN